MKFETYKVRSVFLPLGTPRIYHSDATIEAVLEFISLSADQGLIQIKD